MKNFGSVVQTLIDGLESGEVVLSGPFELVIRNATGREIYKTDVALRTPSQIGWNLSMEMGKTGLIAEIVESLKNPTEI